MHMDDTLIDLFRTICRIRLCESTIADNYHNKVREMRTPIHLCDGQEIIAACICANLGAEDMIFSNHRGHGHYLAKGGDLSAFICELHGKKTGCCRGKGGSMHLCDLKRGIMLSSAIVAGNVPIATGYSMAQKKRQDNTISVVFFGDGASEEGVVFESVCFASMHTLPILYVCENNRIAISTPYELREPKVSIRAKYESIIPSITVDGNDIEEMYFHAKKIISKIRLGCGPQMIECDTYRLRAHSNVGDGVDGLYRSSEQQEFAVKQDPYVRVKDLLISKDILTEDDIEAVEEEILGEIKEAFQKAHESDFPDLLELYSDVYV